MWNARQLFSVHVLSSRITAIGCVLFTFKNRSETEPDMSIMLYYGAALALYPRDALQNIQEVFQVGPLKVVPTPECVCTEPIMSVPRLAKTYAHYMWYSIAGFIGLLIFFNILSIAYSRRRSLSSSFPDPEKHFTNSGSTRRITRLPVALVNVYRVLAYRTTINVTKSFSINLAEVAVCVMYTVTLFTLEFISSTFASSSCIPFC
jgi:hypothetical protein